ncbi:MAG: 3-deoxy-manno-octulosonate cytidylyltransferase [Bacteroidota bacterium]
MPILCVIPARYASSRFPGKPLVDIQGQSMIERVYRQCEASKLLDKVIVATDDTRILGHVKDFGGEVQMTAESHPSGTDRVAEVATNLPAYEWVINVQGDEPFIDPQQIDLLCETLISGKAPIATLYRPLREPERWQNPNVVKLVRDADEKALYFSRAPIPFVRDHADALPKMAAQHIGLYGFARETLLQVAALSPHQLEQTERLEQLRWLAAGIPIQTAQSEHATRAIDTPEDLARILSEI